jgi:CIC family chloride channel protein
VFLVFALTKNLLILKPLLVCCVASYAVARLSHEYSIYQRQLTLLPAPGGHPDGLKMHSTPLKPRDL